MIYLITGWPGAGKSTVAVQHAIYRYACQARRVVANFPVDFAPVATLRRSHLAGASCEVLPDRPTRRDLDALGMGGESEETAGMLIVDEAGGWLNARTWASTAKLDPVTGEKTTERELIIDWLTQSRKRYWDVYIIAQAPAMLDKQVREAVCELVVRIRRLDRFRLAGMSLPRMHIAIVRYGLDTNGPVVERWYYRGGEAHRCFMSYRLFGPEATGYCVLPARDTKWRFVPEAVDTTSGKVVAGAFWFAWLLLLKFPIFASLALAAGFGLVRWFCTDYLLPAERLNGRRMPGLRRHAEAIRLGWRRGALAVELAATRARGSPLSDVPVYRRVPWYGKVRIWTADRSLLGWDRGEQRSPQPSLHLVRQTAHNV